MDCRATKESLRRRGEVYLEDRKNQENIQHIPDDITIVDPINVLAKGSIENPSDRSGVVAQQRLTSTDEKVGDIDGRCSGTSIVMSHTGHFTTSLAVPTAQRKGSPFITNLLKLLIDVLDIEHKVIEDELADGNILLGIIAKEDPGVLEGPILDGLSVMDRQALQLPLSLIELTNHQQVITDTKTVREGE